MSKTIDQRVVEMRFDNANFEKNVSTSMSTLDKLKKSLKFEDSAKGFDNISKAAGRVDMGGLSSGVESVRLKFSALEVMAVTALTNIANRAVDTGLQLVKSLSIDQITAGFEKFGEKTTSVATLRAQGNAMELVEEQLARLNWYTDETSYNYTDMVSNISKFTASGKGLEESVTAMEGIANWAALSGQNAQVASRAMYQISQAMGAGVMRLEDYKSIQNASMDTDEFRQKALDAAVALGTLEKKADGTYSSLVGEAHAFSKSQFTTMLTKGAWFTSDVMMKVFNEYSAAVDQIYEYADEKGITASQAIEELGDQVDAFGLKAFRSAQEAKTFGDAIDSTKDAVSTGWMNTFEILFGNYEEARVLWTDLANAMYDVFASGAEARNELLQGWKDLGGRDMLIEGFWNSWYAFFGDGEEVLGLLGAIKEAFSEIFPPMTSERLVQITEKFRDLTEKFKMSEETANKLKSTFKGFFALLDIGRQGLDALGKIFGHLLQKILPVGNGILGVTSDIGEWIVSIDEAIKSGDGLTKFVEVVNGAIDKFADGIGVAKDYVLDLIKSWTGIDFTKFESFRDVFAAIGEKLSEFGQKIQETFPWVGSLADTISNAFQKIRGSADEELGAVNSALESLKNVGTKIKEVFSNIAEKISTFFAPIIEKLKSIFSGVTITDLIGTGLLVGIFKSVKKFADAFSDLLENFKGIGESVSGVLDSARDAIVLWQKDIKANILIKIAGAVGILAAALWVISKVDADRVLGSLGAITALLGEVTAVMAGIMKWGTNANALEGLSESVQLGKIASAMFVIAGAVLILAAALKKCENLDWDHTLPAMTALFVLLGEMTGAMYGFMAIAKKNPLSKETGTLQSFAVSMIGMSVAILLLANAVAKLGALDKDQLTQGGVAVAALIAALGGMTAALKAIKAGNMTGVAGSMIAMALALTMLYVPIRLFAGLDTATLKQGGMAVGVALVAITAAMSAMKSVNGDLKGVSGSLLAMATALTLLIIPIKILGSMDMNSLANGLIGVMVPLAVMCAVLSRLSGGEYSGIGTNMIAMAAAMTLLVVPIKMLGSMDLGSLVKGVTAFAVALGVLVGAAYLISPIANSLGGLSKAMLAFGAACLGVGVLIGAIALAFTTLATIGAAGVAAILAAITGLLQGLRVMMPIIGEALKDLILTLCDVLKDTAPAITETALYLIDELLRQIEEYVPSIVAHIAKIIQKIGQAITENFGEIGLGDWIGAAIFAGIIGVSALLVKGFASVAKDVPKALIGVAGVAAILVVVGGIIAAMTLLEMDSVMTVAASLSAVLLSLSVVIGVLGMMPLTAGLAAGLVLAEFVAVMAVVMAALGGLNQIPGFSWLMDEGIKVLGQIGEGIGTFVGSVVGAAIERVTAGIAESGTNLALFMENMQPFLDGARNIDQGVLDGIVKLTECMLLISAAEIVEAIAGWLTGKSSLKDFGTALADFGPSFATFADSVSGIDAQQVKASGEAMKAIAEAAAAIPNEGGLLGLLVGENSMTDFADGLEDFGNGLMKYGESVVGIEQYITDIENSVTAAKKIIEVAKLVPNSGGWLGAIVGNNDLDDFGGTMEPFAKALMDYGSAVVGVADYLTDIDDSATAAKKIIEIAKLVPNSGGWLGDIVGNNDLDDFGKTMEPFAEALMDYGSAVSGIGEYSEDITASTKAASEIIDLAKTLTEGTKAKELKKAGENLTAFAEKIEDFIDECSLLDSDDVTTLQAAMQGILDIASGFSTIDTTSVTEFVDAMETIGSTSVDDFLSSFSDSKTKAASAVTTLITNLKDGIESKKNQLKTKFASAAKTALEGVTSKKSDFKTAGEALVKEVVNGIGSQASTVNTKFTTIVSGAAQTIRSYYGQFYSAGAYLAIGVANGIAANTGRVAAAARTMAGAAATASSKRLDEHSPSKVGFKIGDYFGIGFANGIKRNMRRVTVVSSDLAGTAEFSLADIIRKIIDSLNDDPDMTPTIRPVLDLTEIQNGSVAMANLMNTLSGRPVEGTVSIATRTANTMNRTGLASTPASEGNSRPQNTESTTNNFYITGTDPRAIADEVDRKLQRRVERRKAAWA